MGSILHSSIKGDIIKLEFNGSSNFISRLLMLSCCAKIRLSRKAHSLASTLVILGMWWKEPITKLPWWSQIILTTLTLLGFLIAEPLVFNLTHPWGGGFHVAGMIIIFYYYKKGSKFSCTGQNTLYKAS